jgi:hypothetical protein
MLQHVCRVTQLTKNMLSVVHSSETHLRKSMLHCHCTCQDAHTQEAPPTSPKCCCRSAASAAAAAARNAWFVNKLWCQSIWIDAPSFLCLQTQCLWLGDLKLTSGGTTRFPVNESQRVKRPVIVAFGPITINVKLSNMHVMLLLRVK